MTIKKKKILRLLWLLPALAMCAALVFAWMAIPIVNGFKAKAACSCVFVSGRPMSQVQATEFSSLPYAVGTVTVNEQQQTATATVLGLAAKTAVYRQGFGCTLLPQPGAANLPVARPGYVQPPAGSLAWPQGNHNAFDTTLQYDTAHLQQAFEYAFKDGGDGAGFGTRALLVLYNGKIVREQYAKNFSANMPLTGWSMTKSITNALVGILVKQGKMSVTETNLFPEWQSDARREITLDNLLKANSGLKWDEVYFRPSPATNMLYRQSDMAHYAASFAAVHRPGQVFQYSSGTTNMISYLVRQRTGADYYQFAYRELFHKLGMYSAVLEPDASGTYVGSSYCFATARDWARFGLLYMNDGVWNGERILPEGWVRYTSTPSAAAKNGEYGAQFWLNAGQPGNPANRTYPGVPPDCLYAQGFQGQRVWIIPSRKVVVVRLSLQQHDDFYENDFLTNLLAAFPSS